MVSIHVLLFLRWTKLTKVGLMKDESHLCRTHDDMWDHYLSLSPLFHSSSFQIKLLSFWLISLYDDGGGVVMMRMMILVEKRE